MGEMKEYKVRIELGTYELESDGENEEDAIQWAIVQLSEDTGFTGLIQNATITAEEQ